MRVQAIRVGWIAAMVLAIAPASAQTPGDGGIKARVALAIARFAEMPDRDSAAPLQLCVAVHGTPPRALLALSGEKIGAHGVEVQVGPPFADCDVLYVHESFADWRGLLDEPSLAALTVGDVPGFLAAGGMVELVIDSDAVRFDVNLGALRRRQIRLPAQVLKLARQVRE